MVLAGLEVAKPDRFSLSAYARTVIDHLSKCQVPISEGLADEEFSRVEKKYGFFFPPDLKAILQEGLPVGTGFPNWRSGSEQHLRMMLTLPVVGLCYEIARGRFWWKRWGCKPADIGVAIEIARTAFKTAPVLIPIYSHCYIPCNPNLAGNPVFFVYEKDIFYCGYDIAHFFEREAFVPHEFQAAFGVDAENHQKDNARKNFVKNEGRKRNWQSDVHLRQLANRAWNELESSVSRKRSWGSGMRHTKNGEVLGTKSAREALPQTAHIPSATGNSPKMDGYVVSTFMYFHKRSLPMKIQNYFTLVAPPWAAKTARYIEIWSDLIEEQGSLDLRATESPHPAFKVDAVNKRKSVEKHVKSKEGAMSEFESSRSRKRSWLWGYFDDVGKRLRKGGWREDEVTEMVESVLPKEHQMLAISRDGYSVLDTLALQLDILSASLRKAGWSAEDVLEALHFDPLSSSRTTKS